MVVTCQGQLREFWGVLTTCSEHFAHCTWENECLDCVHYQLWIPFFSTWLRNHWENVEHFPRTEKAESWQEVDWLCSVMSYLATKGSIACGKGYVFLKNLQCVIETKFPFPLQSLGSWQLHIECYRYKDAFTQVSSVILYTCCHFTCHLGDSI